MSNAADLVRPVGNGSDRLPVIEPANEDLVFPCNSNIPPAIPNGDQYQLVFLRAEKVNQWGRAKLFLWFKMSTPGDWIGQDCYMPCNVAPNGKWGPFIEVLADVCPGGRETA